MVKANEPIPKLLYDDVVLGLVLGDAYISDNTKITGHSSLTLAQTPRRIDFLYHVQEYFLTLGLKSSIRVSHSKYNGKERSTAYLTTSHNIVFDKLREWWYGETKKRLPNDLKLTPKMISYWFMCDGGSYWMNPKGNVFQGIDIQLCTDSFSENDLIIIVNQLSDKFNVDFRLYNNQNKYWRLRMFKNTDTERFMNLVEPYIHSVFQYKIKHLESSK